MSLSDMFRKKKPSAVSPLLEKKFNEESKSGSKFALNFLKGLPLTGDSLKGLVGRVKSRFGQVKAKGGKLGLSYHDDELALAFIQYQGEEPQLQFCEYQHAENYGKAGRELTGLVTKHGLEGVSCNFVLSADDYNLLLIEAPAVEESELADAARWKIKDMVDRPLDDLVISVFRVPDDAYRVNRDMLYVVAADRRRIEHVVELVYESGLKLESIDIPELAMLNILELQNISDENGVAMIDLRHNGSLLSLCKNNALYLTRHLNTQVGEDIASSYDWDAVKERLILEIQRSLDYYESQMGQGHVNRVLLAPRKQDSEALSMQLNQEMGVQVEVLNLGGLASGHALSMEKQNSCLMAIGGALRVDEAA